MADEYKPIEFPKYLAKYGCTVENAEQEAAVLADPAAMVEQTTSAQGSTYKVVVPSPSFQANQAPEPRVVVPTIKPEPTPPATSVKTTPPEILKSSRPSPFPKKGR